MVCHWWPLLRLCTDLTKVGYCACYLVTIFILGQYVLSCVKDMVRFLWLTAMVQFVRFLWLSASQYGAICKESLVSDSHLLILAITVWFLDLVESALSSFFLSIFVSLFAILN